MPTIKDSLYFNYDGISSSTYGLININLDGGMFDEQLVADREVVETRIRGNDKSLLHRVEESPIEFPLTIAFEKNYTDAEINNVILWLFQDVYKPLYFEDKPNRVFYCMPVGESRLAHTGLKDGYITLTMKCNSSKIYSGVNETALTSVRNTSATVTINNDGHADIHPEISILNTIESVKKADFTNKVSGSLTENPHIVKYAFGNSLLSPSDTVSSAEVSNTRYDEIKTLNGTVATYTQTANGNMAQYMFSFNLIEHVQRKYNFTIPAVTTAEKVTWLKANITKLTANWHGLGSTVLSTPTTKADFTNKISGSLTENPHISKVVGNSALQSPSQITVNELTSSNYTKINSLNGTLYSPSTTVNGEMAQHLFSFNLIEHVQRKYNFTIPGSTVADKVTWLKANVSKLTANWHGKGSGSSGNKASLEPFHVVGNNYDGIDKVSHTNGTITKLTRSLPYGHQISNYIDSNGFIHWLAYADASNGTIASTIETDFVELEVELKSGYNASLKAWKGDTSSYMTSTVNHTKTTIDKLFFVTPTNYITTDGFVHYISFADASNGLAPSQIQTDFIELEVEVKPTAITSNVVIENLSNGNKIFEVRDLTHLEDIYINCEKEIIETDIVGVYRYDKIIGDFLELIKGENQIKVTGSCDIQFRYQNKYKF